VYHSGSAIAFFSTMEAYAVEAVRHRLPSFRAVPAERLRVRPLTGGMVS
jgi:hypothetical protein